MTPPARPTCHQVQGLANVLVVGGAPLDRLEVAQEFHREGTWRSGSLVAVDASRDASLLHDALQAWLAGNVLDSNRDLLRRADRGTLFLDRIECLPPATQQLLLVLIRCRDGHEGDLDRQARWLGRIVTGSSGPLVDAVNEGRFSRALEDALDKVRVPVGGRDHVPSG